MYPLNISDGRCGFAKGEESAKSLIKERWTQERYEAGEKITFPVCL